MKLRPLKTDKDYEKLLSWIDGKFDEKVKMNSVEGESLQIGLLLIKQYEDQHYPVSFPDPIEAVKLKMEELL